MNHIILMTGWGMGYYDNHFTDMEGKALRSDLPRIARFTCGSSST